MEGRRMGRSLKRSITVYLSKLKKQSLSGRRSAAAAASTATSSSLFSACKYPKTPSFASVRGKEPAATPAATLSDIDRFLFENFNSLYSAADGSWDSTTTATESGCFSSESPRFAAGEPTPDVRASHRFFVGPGISNSLVEEARLSAASTSASSRPSTSAAEPKLPDGSVPVTTFTKDPYSDFRRSMQEMVEMRHGAGERRQPLDWEFMEDLLFCYLDLNDRSVHKYVLGAFTDLTVSFRRGDAAVPAKGGGDDGRRGRSGEVTSCPDEASDMESAGDRSVAVGGGHA